MSAHDIILILHNLLRWLVLLAGIGAAGRALFAWLRKAPWSSLDNGLSLLFTISIDIQVLLGLLLYLFLSPITTENFSNLGDAMSRPEARFFLVEHLFYMVLALGLAHAGRALARRAVSDRSRQRRAAIFFTLALLVILVGMPWMRPLLRLSAA